MKSTTLGLIAFSLVAIFLLTSLVVAVDMIDPLWWPTYHQDPLRQGVSSMAPEDGANINIIWTWPRTDVVPIHAANDTVDMPSAGDASGWKDPDPDLLVNGITVDDLPRDSYGMSINRNGYKWATVTRDNTGTVDQFGNPVPTVNVVTATWTIPVVFNIGHDPRDGYFEVQAWFPSSGGGKRNSQAARFEVIDRDGRSHIRIVDQRTGGTWTSLSRTPFHLGPGDTIKLTNIMDAATYDSLVEEDANNQRNGLPSNLVASTIVCADAIRLVSGTGVEIYSSPIAGKPTIDFFDGVSTIQKQVELAWFGDIEGPIASLADGIDDFGAIYCVRSDFVDTFDRDNDWLKPEAVAVGSTRWRYPAGGRYDLARKPIDRDPIEGPIGRLTGVGGVLSSPTLVEIDTATTQTLAVVVGGMDGQVYCVDAVTGKLIWKGPGVTMPESQSTNADWIEETNGVTGRYDAFGGKFLYHLPTRDDYDESTNGKDTIVYDVSAQTGTNESDPGADAQKVNEGHLYAIYAWIPARLSTDAGRIRDAFYRISYRDTGTGGTAREWVSIDQRDASDNADTLAPLPDDPGAGRWVRLGTSYWNPSKVELTTHTGMDVTELTDSAGNARVVVADAIMVVPDEIGPFSYSSPVWDKTVASDQSKVYIGNANGRIYALQTRPSDEYRVNFATKLNWTFPKVQTANPASQDIDALASSWGSIISSPVFFGSDSASGRLLVSTTQGKVYSIKDLNNDEKRIDLDWEYDSAEKVDTGGTINGSLGESEPFSSSPAVYGTTVYVPSASGRLHALHFQPQGTGKSQRAWMFPDRAASAVPLAAFRYSTPAVVKLPGEASHRIYVGSTGGRVYGFRDDGTSGRLLKEGGVDDTTGDFLPFEFKNPQVMGPVQGSVALDGGSSGTDDESDYGKFYYGNMYIGTMGSGSLADDGGFFWLNRSTGFASSNGVALWNYSGYTGLGSVFSSPAVANHYAYVGIGKGRLCAFSATAFGGQWMGGGEAEKDEEPFPRAKPADIRKGTSPEVDLFTAPVYDQTIAIFKKWLPTTPGLPTDKVTDLPTVTGLDPTNFFLDSDYKGTAPWKGHKRAFTYGTASSPGNPRQVYLEWGEDIYAIAWNLPPLMRQPLLDGSTVDPIAPGAITDDGVGTSDQRGAVSFRFIDNSPGYGSGGTLSPKHPDAIYEYWDTWKDESGNVQDVKRSVAFVKVDIRADSQNPPPPGVGWDVSVAVATQPPASVSKEREAVLPVSVPLLTGNAGSWTVKGASALTSLSTELRYIKIPPQPVGVNCPLAIIDEGIRPSLTGPTKGAVVGLAWPPSDLAGGLKPNRYDLTAHFNGNGYAIPGADATDMSTSTWNEILPIVYLGWGTHGSNTMIGRVGTADRSAVGLRVTAKATHPTTGDPISYRTDAIRTLRFQTGDLHWQGGNGAAQNMLPWDYAPFFTPTGLKWTTRLQRDYPDISRREAVFQKSPDNNDPSIEKTMLQPGMPRAGFGGAANVAYEDSVLRGDAVESWVEVPRFQPANTSQPGYSTTVLAFLDTNNNGRFDGGEITADRPDARTETYRKFQLSLDVPPDYHMVVEKPLTVEITGADRAPAPHGLGIGVTPEELAAGDWYKNFTVRNLGNVNLYNINIAKWDLFADNVNPAFPLKGYLMTQPDPFGSPVPPPLQTGIVSSFDGWDPKWGNIQGEPFESFLDAKGLPVGDYGYALSKAAVGDAGGMPLTIPDSRKVKNWATRGDIQAINALGGPIEPSVSVRVPLSQPSGTYHQVVPVFADFDGDGTLDLASEPRTNPAFTLNVTVAEDRITGGPTPGSAVQVDTTSNATSGDVQPTAFRDPSTGAVNVIWSTNRSFPKLGDPPAPVTAENPWFLFQGGLPYNQDTADYTGPAEHYNWQFGVTPSPAIGSNPAIPAMWFKTPLPGDPNYQFPQYLPQPVSNVRWPDTPPIPAGWEPVPSSLKYSAPFVARAEGGGNTWVAFEGQIDAKDPATKKIARESRIFYAPLANGQLPDGTAQVRSLIRDPRSAKLAPKLASYITGSSPGTENMLLTWHGGDAGKWTMFAALNQSPADAHNPDAWSPDVRFSTPSCMVSTAEPSPVHRSIQLLRANSDGSASAVTEEKIFDLAYTGAWKFDQSTDIIFTRYLWNGDPQSPKLDVIRMPRVNEELLRDSKRNIYTSEHLSWLRPPGDGATDEWGNPNATNPFIRVEIPADGTTPARVISATDGGVDGAVGTAIAPLIDRATNVYTYSYAANSAAANTLGQTLVDFSAGIIRFTNPLPPKTKVYAQYTPQAQRLTRGLEQDSAPFMFIEKTGFSSPGVVLGEDTSNEPVNMPIGRRWLFWRKPSGGVLASSIYYKTYRMTADILDSSGQPYAIKLQSNGAPAYEFDDATGAKLKFPVEVSWDGKKIFFPADFERYPGQPDYPGPLQITLMPTGNNPDTEDIKLVLDTITWQEELPETALPTRQRINEGQVSAFADPSVSPTKVWVFWSSTRAGKSDIYYQTISPNFRAIY